MRKRTLSTYLLAVVTTLLVVLLLACKAAPKTTPAPAPTVTATATATVTAAPATVTATAAPAPTVTATATSTVTATALPVVTVKMLRSFALDSPFNIAYRYFLEEGNKMGEGKLVFKDGGGTEVAPPFDQIKLAKAGIIDLLITPTVYPGAEFYEAWPLDPGIMGAMGPDVRKIGMTAALDKMARKKMGVAFLGAPGWYTFTIFLSKPITKLADLKGMKLRSTPSYDLLFKPLGVSTVVVPPTEVLTALQTGLVDGLAWPSDYIIATGYAPYLKYQVYPELWKAPGNGAYANAAWFDALPQWHKDKLMEIMVKAEQESIPRAEASSAAEIKKVRAAGVKPIVLSDADWFEAERIIFEETNKLLRDKAAGNAEEVIKYLNMFYPPKQVWLPTYDWK
ncbi:MAG: TRAP transporter substrate-binding protein DctP [Chloroflexi bacterium]|nr:TRAP transporter substrate-binding protein DctP [Chloroflexota bacterium]